MGIGHGFATQNSDDLLWGWLKAGARGHPPCHQFDKFWIGPVLHFAPNLRNLLL